MKQNMRKWCESLAHGGTISALPLLSTPGLQLIGRTVSDAARSAEVQAECIRALAARYPSAAAVTMMDLSVEAEAFGCSVAWADHEVPTVSGRLLDGVDGVASLAVPTVSSGRTGMYLEAARLAAQSIPDRPLLGGHIGPYSLAGRLFDMTEIMTAILLEPDAIHELLGKCAEFLADYAKGFKEAGADGVIIAEPAAGLLSVDLCEEFSSQYVKRIVDAVQDDSFTVILHNCGNTAALVDSMAGTGAMGLHFGNVVKMSEILPHVPPDRVAMGNIDPVGVLKSGNPAGVEAAVKCLLDGMAKYPNFVISSGCDIPPSTPLENIDAFFRAVEHHK